jgi:hypothetical protein
VSADTATTARTPTQHALAIAATLPLGAVAACAVARLLWPSTLNPIVDFGTLLGAGILGCLLGSWILFRALGRAKARWVMLLVVYDLAMPLAVFGLVFLIEVARGKS